MLNQNERESNGVATVTQSELQELKTRVHRRLLDTMDFNEARRLPSDQLHSECMRRVDVLLTEQKRPLSAPEKRQLLQEVMDEIFGFGPIEEFLRDNGVNDILCNGPAQIYVERGGRLELTTTRFRDSAHMVQVIQRIASGVGRRCDESQPMLDARLPDGSRVNAIIPPLALDGPAVSIRRFGGKPIDIERLIEFDAMTKEMATFLEGCVTCKCNILISGGTGTGKTTLLNCLSRWIPMGERVVTIEDAAELQLQRDHVVRLETRPPNIEGKGEITQRDLLRNCLRMRPDRIVIGECRGGEALDMLQAMNTGHEGSMTTVHANTTRDATRRLESMVSMAGLNFPIAVIRQQIASALHLVVQATRMTGGKRRVTSVSEVTGMEGDVICLQEIFVFKQTGLDGEGNATGYFECCGIRPRILERLSAEGIDLPPQFFERRILSKNPMRRAADRQ